MEVTGKPEVEVTTVLFDGGQDENRAAELLLEIDNQLSSWEDTCKNTEWHQTQNKRGKVITSIK